MSKELEKVQEDAKAAALGLFQKMSAMCDDATFVAECFGKSMSLEAFQSALIEKQKAAVTQLKADLDAAKKATPAPAGAAPVAFNAQAPAAAPKELTFVELAHKTALDLKISVAAAYSKVAAENPALYQKHLEGCPIAKR